MPGAGKSSGTKRWSLRCLPTYGESTTHSTPAAANSPAGPMPERSSRCGEPIAPALTTISRSATTCTSLPSALRYSTPTAWRPVVLDIAARAVEPPPTSEGPDRRFAGARLRRTSRSRTGGASASAAARPRGGRTWTTGTTTPRAARQPARTAHPCAAVTTAANTKAAGTSKPSTAGTAGPALSSTSTTCHSLRSGANCQTPSRMPPHGTGPRRPNPTAISTANADSGTTPASGPTPARRPPVLIREPAGYAGRGMLCESGWAKLGT